MTTRFSRVYSPGATNSHSCENMNGAAAITPSSTVSFRLNMKPAIGSV